MLSVVTLILFLMPMFHSGGSIVQTHHQRNVKSVGPNKQISREWQAATYRGLTMGGSTERDMIRILGQPKWWELFDEDRSQPERWYHYENGGDFPHELVFNIDRRSRVILRMILYPEDLSVKQAINRFGENYVATRYEFCEGFEEQESAPLYENPAGQFRYLEYRNRGIALAIGNNDKVDFILYVSERIGAPSSKCKKAGNEFRRTLQPPNSNGFPEQTATRGSQRSSETVDDSYLDSIDSNYIIWIGDS